VYSGDVIVKEFPARLHLGIYVDLIRSSEDIGHVSLSLKLDGTELAKIDADMSKQGIGMPTTIIVQAMELNAKADCRFSIDVTGKGFRKLTALDKRIYQGEVAGR
jgi:hypothetical protein